MPHSYGKSNFKIDKFTKNRLAVLFIYIHMLKAIFQTQIKGLARAERRLIHPSKWSSESPLSFGVNYKGGTHCHHKCWGTFLNLLQKNCKYLSYFRLLEVHKLIFWTLWLQIRKVQTKRHRLLQLKLKITLFFLPLGYDVNWTFLCQKLTKFIHFPH